MQKGRSLMLEQVELKIQELQKAQADEYYKKKEGRRSDALPLSSEYADCIQCNGNESEDQCRDTTADNDIQLFDGQVDLIVPALLRLLPQGRRRLIFDPHGRGFLLEIGILIFFHYFLATYLRISIATAVITTRP